MGLINVEIISDFGKLGALRGVWENLSGGSASSRDSYEQYRNLISTHANQDAMRLVVVYEKGQIVALAPFVLLNERKSYAIGGKLLCALPVRVLRLMNDTFIGRNTCDVARHIFGALCTCTVYDIVIFQEHEVKGPFFSVIRTALADSPWKLKNPFHKVSIHWEIDLPPTFEEYMAGFTSKKRYNLRRAVRIFDTQYHGSLRIVTEPDDVDWFLTAAERVSRVTWQWSLGQRLRSDETTRCRYVADARARRLRCYILCADGVPSAFVGGTVRDGVYDYGIVGFDPGYANASPGIVLLMKIIEDLIANSDCRILDFGTGGDDIGYKSCFGNRCYEAICLEARRRWALYPIMLWAIQDGVNVSKRIGNALLGDGSVKRRIKRWLKNYDVVAK